MFSKLDEMPAVERNISSEQRIFEGDLKQSIDWLKQIQELIKNPDKIDDSLMDAVKGQLSNVRKVLDDSAAHLDEMLDVKQSK